MGRWLPLGRHQGRHKCPTRGAQRLSRADLYRRQMPPSPTTFTQSNHSPNPFQIALQPFQARASMIPLCSFHVHCQPRSLRYVPQMLVGAETGRFIFVQKDEREAVLQVKVHTPYLFRLCVCKVQFFDDSPTHPSPPSRTGKTTKMCHLIFGPKAGLNCCWRVRGAEDDGLVSHAPPSLLKSLPRNRNGKITLASPVLDQSSRLCG